MQTYVSRFHISEALYSQSSIVGINTIFFFRFVGE